MAYDLEPEVYSIEQLLAISLIPLPDHKNIALHINLNTGMNRLGLEPNDINNLIKIIKENPQLRIESVFSHLSSSDDVEQDDYSNQQFLQFEFLSEQIISAFSHSIMRHMLNSAGIARFNKNQYDGVRLGLGLYGIDTSGKIAELQKVHHLKSKIIQIKKYAKGTSIGYNRSIITSKDSIIATIPIGYADGLPRAAGNSRYAVKIEGQEALIIGNICMDLIMVDITDLKGISMGSMVTIFGENHPIETLAKRANTIPYEVLSNMSPRLRRIFIQE